MESNVFSFPCGSDGKESACKAGDLGLIPVLGRSPAEGKGYPLQYSGLENSTDCIVLLLLLSRFSHVRLFATHGVLQARILEWVAVPFCRGSSQPRDQNQVSRIAGRFFIVWAMRKVGKVSGIPISLRIFHSLLWSTQLKALCSQWSRSRCFSGILLLFLWSSRCSQFDLWFLCLF